MGGKDIVVGTMEAGELTSVLVYALQILSSLMIVSFVFVLNMIAGASTDRIAEVLREEPDLANKEQTVKEVPNGDIVFDHVDFSYAGEGGKLALEGCEPAYQIRADDRHLWEEPEAPRALWCS